MLTSTNGTDHPHSMHLSRRSSIDLNAEQFSQEWKQPSMRYISEHDVLRMSILERVSDDISIAEVKPSPFTSAFLNGDATGRYRLDNKITDVLVSQGLPLSTLRGGALSPLNPITLVEHRYRYSIPEDATHYAFAYPPFRGLTAELIDIVAQELELGETALHFLLAGGFVYFDAHEKIVQINALSNSPARTRFDLKRCAKSETVFPKLGVRALNAQGRFHAVALDTLLVKGMETFCWVRPREAPSGVNAEMAAESWPNGAFIFKYLDGSHQIYAIQWYGLADDGAQSRDVVEHSAFEQILRASIISAEELDDVLTRTARPRDVAGREDQLDDDDIITTESLRLARIEALNEPSLDKYEGAHMNALMWASREGIPNAVRRLLNVGALSITDSLILALERDNAETSRVIMSHRRAQWLELLVDKCSSPTLIDKLILRASELCADDMTLIPRQVGCTAHAQCPCSSPTPCILLTVACALRVRHRSGC